MNSTGYLYFRRLCLITIFAVYFLILVGGVVRSSGAGMGCPDWPTCFGQWIPPLSESDLPANYQEIYRHKGYAETKFNAIKTWTEYINRLIGVLIGFFVFATFIASFVYRPRNIRLIIMSGAIFLLTGFQGWLGAVVVSSLLAPWMVTIHMLVALVIIVLLIYLYFLSDDRPGAPLLPPPFRLWIGVALLLTLMQIILGTQVREAVDIIIDTLGYEQRAQWAIHLNGIFLVHRSFSWLLLALAILIPVLLWKKYGTFKAPAVRWTGLIAGLIIIEALTGIILAYAGFPATAQPVHLLLATLIFGLQFAALLKKNTNGANGQAPYNQK